MPTPHLAHGASPPSASPAMGTKRSDHWFCLFRDLVAETYAQTGKVHTVTQKGERESGSSSPQAGVAVLGQLLDNPFPSWRIQGSGRPAAVKGATWAIFVTVKTSLKQSGQEQRGEFVPPTTKPEFPSFWPSPRLTALRYYLLPGISAGFVEHSSLGSSMQAF